MNVIDYMPWLISLLDGLHSLVSYLNRQEIYTLEDMLASQRASRYDIFGVRF